MTPEPQSARAILFPKPPALIRCSHCGDRAKKGSNLCRPCLRRQPSERLS